MKLNVVSLLGLLVCLVNCSSAPQPSIESKIQTRLTGEFKDAPLSEVVQFLSREAQVNVVVDGALKDKDLKRVTLKFAQLSLEHILRHVASQLDLRYSVEGDIIVIHRPS